MSFQTFLKNNKILAMFNWINPCVRIIRLLRLKRKNIILLIKFE